MNIAHATNKLGVVKANILHHLQRNGRSKVLDMEMVMSRGKASVAVDGMASEYTFESWEFGVVEGGAA